MRGNRARIAPLTYVGLVLVVLSAAAGALAGFGHQWGWWSFRQGFGLLRWAAYGGALAALLCLLGGINALHHRLWGRTGLAAAGLLIGATVFLLPMKQLGLARTLPRIHDITTDTKNPPKFADVLPLRKGAANSAVYEGAKIAALQKKGYPDIRPAFYAAPPQKVFTAAKDVAHEMGWEIVSANAGAGRIEATDTTYWFGFKDDVVIRIRREGERTRLDIRSLSRVGLSDVGKNAARVRAFLKALEQRLSS